ncbi:MAG: hypothetical protein GW913_05680 [Myxococcales bacterium]|nr:hypothetical protein [Myxococcales bacterium]
MSGSAVCDGVDARLLAFDGKWLVLDAPRAWAPGSPMAIVADLGGATHRLDARSLGSQRQADGRFRVKMRMVSLRRASREALLAVLPTTASPAV